RHTADELQSGMTENGQYGPAPDPLRKLIARWELSGRGVTAGQIAVLLWCSYLVGMQLPGERAVFSQLRLEFAPQSDFDQSPLSYAARVTDFDERFDLLQVDADLRRGEAACARAEL